MDKAVLLAAGRGTRMQHGCETATLTAAQAAVASAGIKSMMPVGRPFIDYVLSGLKSAGYRRVCLVVAPGCDPLRDHAEQFSRDGFEIQFAAQTAPLGTAHALAAATDFVAGDPFLAINSDNYYPTEVLARMRHLEGSAVAAFRAEGLLRGNITADRLRNYALISADSRGRLVRLIEKPGASFSLGGNGPVLINMNCWRFTPAIFTSCRAIPLSPRNEYELTDAVSYAINVLGEQFSVIEVDEPVLDLSTRGDVAEVTRRLAAVAVDL